MKVLIYCKKIFLVVFISAVILLQLNNSSFAQWEVMNGPYGGTIFTLNKMDNWIFAGTPMGIFRSSNNGRVWDRVLTFRDKTVRTIVNDGKNIIARSLKSFFRSTSSGTTWSEINNGINAENVYGMFVFSNEIYAAEKKNLFRLDLNTETWTKVAAEIPNNEAVQSFCANGTYIFVLTTSGNIYRIKKAEGNWEKVLSGYYSRYDNVFFVNSGEIYFASNKGLLKTLDNFSTYTILNSISCNCVTVKDNFILTGSFGSGLSVSIDNGSSWNDIRLINEKYYSVLISDRTFFAGAFMGGVWLSEDNGSEWINSSRGIDIPFISNIILMDKKLLCCGEGIGVYQSVNGGYEWTESNKGLNTASTNLFSIFNSKLFLGTAKGVYVSNDQGVTWETANVSLPQNFNVNYFMNYDNKYLYAGGNGLHYTTNDGRSWVNCLENLPPSTEVMSIFKSDKKVIIGTKDGIFSCELPGSPWERVKSDMKKQAEINSLVKISDFILATTLSGIYSSPDMGINWGMIKNSFADYGKLIALDNYLIYTKGMNVSADNGRTWKSHGEDLKDYITENNTVSIVNSAVILNEDVFVGTTCGPIFKIRALNLFNP